jgi:2-oxo-4-hydroxy-4-carboxy--5-ureidoimidazoline (OHCU) decarboxylase
LIHAPRIALSSYWKLSDQEKFELLKNIFEDSSWIIKRGLEGLNQEFRTVAELFQHFHDVFSHATTEEKLGVLRAHPDLVGKAALQGVIRLHSLDLLILTLRSSDEGKYAGTKGCRIGRFK